MKHSSTVAVLCDGKILLGKRRDTGLYTLPGGGREEFETDEDCAKRELFEESGIVAYKLDHIIDWRVWDKNRNSVSIHGYSLIYDGSATVRFDPDKEVKKWEWISYRYGNLPIDVENNLAYKNNKLLQALVIQKSFFVKAEPLLYIEA